MRDPGGTNFSSCSLNQPRELLWRNSQLGLEIKAVGARFGSQFVRVLCEFCESFGGVLGVECRESVVDHGDEESGEV
jgi:hypothetical protein